VLLQGLATLLSFLLFYLALIALNINVSYITAVFVLGVSYTFSHRGQLELSAGSFNVLANPRWNTTVPEWFTQLSLVSWIDLGEPPAGIMAP